MNCDQMDGCTLHKIYGLAWEEGKVWEDWAKTIIILLYKGKDRRNEYENYGGTILFKYGWIGGIRMVKKHGTKKYFVSITFWLTVFFKDSSEEDSWLKHWRNKVLLVRPLSLHQLNLAHYLWIGLWKIFYWIDTGNDRVEFAKYREEFNMLPVMRPTSGSPAYIHCCDATHQWVVQQFSHMSHFNLIINRNWII